ncbi:Hsp20/alpha crystallin family protein [Longispora albida]|uniref:Hsp20/alpha crystallin family protein n=1 Tax=Longispora albida TaxID=203523 RepID=UPI0003606915|nr:Hsp20/alpha crystallin family protein [Longispora albida]
MSSLRFDPFRELDRWTNEVLGTARTPRLMPLDAFREGENYVLRFDLPGVDESSLQVMAENTTLTVRAERRPERPEGAAYLVAERPVGVFQRQIALSNGLDLGAISAGYTDGVLTVTIPVAEHAKPRQISVDRRSAQHEGHKMISGEPAPADARQPAAVGA